jgi:hypothetical protein
MLKNISANTKSTNVIYIFLKKYLSRDTIPLAGAI